MRRVFVSSLVALLALPLFSATTARETHVVEVVQVPVYVSTPAGAVAGLARENFALYVNGKPQPFEYFDVIDFAKMTGGSDVRQRRLYCLVFDLVYSTPNDIHRAQQAAAQLVGNASASDLFAVATYTARNGVDIIVPFTHDRATATRAVLSLRPSTGGDPLRLALSDRELTPRLETPANDELVAERMRHVVDDEVEALSLLAQQLGALEGQKHVVLLSRGFDAGLLHGAFSPQRDDFLLRTMPPLISQPSSIGVRAAQRLPQANGQALMSLRKLTATYTICGVFLDAIDVAGVRPTTDPSANESLYALAIDTGGTVVEHRNDLVEALEVLSDRQRVVYLLGFRAPEGTPDRNTIEVRLRGVEGNPDVRYRPSYARLTTAAEADNGLRLADILINDIPQTGITVSATASGPAVTVSIPARELLAQIDGKTAEAEAMLYVFLGSRVVATDVKRIGLDAERAAAASGDGTIKFAQSFDLPPGDYTVKVLVRLGDSMGFAKTDLMVPR